MAEYIDESGGKYQIVLFSDGNIVSRRVSDGRLVGAMGVVPPEPEPEPEPPGGFKSVTSNRSSKPSMTGDSSTLDAFLKKLFKSSSIELDKFSKSSIGYYDFVAATVMFSIIFDTV